MFASVRRFSRTTSTFLEDGCRGSVGEPLCAIAIRLVRSQLSPALVQNGDEERGTGRYDGVRHSFCVGLTRR
jgi:hypothetical protein